MNNYRAFYKLFEQTSENWSIIHWLNNIITLKHIIILFIIIHYEIHLQ